MERRTFLAGTSAVLLTASVGVEGQQTGKIWRIGFLSLNSDAEPYKRWPAAFREGLR